MRAKVLGYRVVDIPAKDGESGTKGTSIFFSYGGGYGIIGEEADKTFLRQQADGTTGLPEGFKPGCIVNIDFTAKGKLLGLSLIDGKGA